MGIFEQIHNQQAESKHLAFYSILCFICFTLITAVILNTKHRSGIAYWTEEIVNCHMDDNEKNIISWVMRLDQPPIPHMSKNMWHVSRLTWQWQTYFAFDIITTEKNTTIIESMNSMESGVAAFYNLLFKSREI